MAPLRELAGRHTALEDHEVDHLTRLVAAWSVLADLAFADMVLYAPTDATASQFVVLGHRRAATAPTVYPDDPLGSTVPSADRGELANCWRQQCCQFDVEDADLVPVRVQSRVVAVVGAERRAGSGDPSGLEATYRQLWRRFATMIEQGSFPLVGSDPASELREPRVGDGVVVVGRGQAVEFASPNATSALHRLGVHARVVGHRLGEVGLDDGLVRRAIESRQHSAGEIGTGAVVVAVRCIPLIDDGRVTGAVVVCRDVTELRDRDRLLLSKDTTIREIHHRVKNNLQTIQSLLQLQTRRLTTDEARTAVAQSARRIGAIAVVHEMLASDVSDTVEFDAVVEEVVRLIHEGLTSPDRPTRIDVVGTIGLVSGEVAMPLAVVVAELVQNAIDHGSADDGIVQVELAASGRELHLRVSDDGPGVPPGFRLDRDAGLGLTIVRTFVVSDLGGTVTIGAQSQHSTGAMVVDVRLPRSSAGTVGIGRGDG